MTTIERLTRILAQRYKLDSARLTPEQPLAALGIDSLGMVEMLFFIEEEFRIQLPSEGISFGTLGEAARYIDELTDRQHAASPAPEGEPSRTSAAAAPDRGA